MVNYLLKIPFIQYSVFTEIFLLISSLTLLVFGVKKGDKATRKIACIATVILSFAIFGAIYANHAIFNPFAEYYRIDFFTTIVKILIIVSAIISLLLYIGHLDYNPYNARFEYGIIILLAVIGMLILVSAKDFLTLYMGIELQSLALYILAAINRTNLKSTEAGFKYFVLGALSSAILLYGISLIYGFTGSLNFNDINTSLNQIGEGNLGVIVGLVFIIISLLFKVSAVPFHMWTPDVYEGAPTSVTIFLASTPKLAAFIVLFRVLTEAFSSYYLDWSQIIALVAVISLIIGSLGAIMQQNFKRLLAFSSINHVGFMLLAILVNNNLGIEALLVYMFIYLSLIFGSFSFLMLIKQAHHTADGADKKSLEDIDAFAGLARAKPLVALGMVIILLSMSGLPPFAGFFGKFMIFKAALAGSFNVIAVIAALSAVISVFYYLKIIKIMFFDDLSDNYNKNAAFITKLIFAFMVLFNLLFFIKADLFLAFAANAVEYLF
ncbi:MAG: NADH-quinone oxidoreductase subunit N [Rickettsiales bacterium]